MKRTVADTLNKADKVRRLSVLNQPIDHQHLLNKLSQQDKVNTTPELETAQVRTKLSGDLADLNFL